MSMVDTLFEINGVRKRFLLRQSVVDRFLKHEEYVEAVDDVSFRIRTGEILGVVGESGSGKTTLGRLLLKLIKPTFGKITFEGRELASLSKSELRTFRRRAQGIFQDPFASLSDRLRVFDIIAEPLLIHKVADLRDTKRKVYAALESVGLTPPAAFARKYPHQLSGGQLQRAAIARALVLEPTFMMADEPVSMLDVSVRAGILSLLLQLAKRFGMTMLFITHDLAVARLACDRIAVMRQGKIVEIGATEDVIANPANEYTQRLLMAVPEPIPPK